MTTWKLRYTQPQLKPGNTIVREEMLEDMGTENYQEALTRAKDFLSKGGIVIDALHHRRELVSLIQDTPTPGTEAIRDAFFAHKEMNPGPGQLTSLQKRMQDQGSPVLIK